MIAAIAINSAELFTLNYKHFKPLETLGAKTLLAKPKREDIKNS